jgi:hypothetical protein
MQIPTISEWDMYAGGISAYKDTHSYGLTTDIGNYKIDPPARRGQGYSLRFENVKGIYGSGLHQWIDQDGVTSGGGHSWRRAKSPAQAASWARKHYKRAIADRWALEQTASFKRAEGERLRREKPLPGLKGNPGLGHGGRLGKLDRKAISAFLGQEAFVGHKLESTGKRLNGLWMGGTGIAEWKSTKMGSLIHLHDLGSRSGQAVQRVLLKMAPKNWVKNPYLGDAVKLAKARRSKPPPLPRKKKPNPLSLFGFRAPDMAETKQLLTLHRRLLKEEHQRRAKAKNFFSRKLAEHEIKDIEKTIKRLEAQKKKLEQKGPKRTSNPGKRVSLRTVMAKALK